MTTKTGIWTIKGIWLKGNTHTHTTHSDGRCTPEEIVRAYGRHGYDFVFFTDHDKRTAPPKHIRKPLMIPAVEIAFGFKGYGYHFVCLGIKADWAPQAFHSPMQALNWARRAGVFLVQAHPAWCGCPSSRCVFRNNRTCPGVEIYNTACDRTIGKGYSVTHWDELLDAGHRLFGLAVDDAHFPLDIAGGWIMLKAKARSAGAILQALAQGRFYSSQGPRIKSIVIRGREIRVVCSPVKRINFISNRSSGRSVFSGKRRLTSAVYPKPKRTPDGRCYVRIELVDASGKMAWSNPMFF